MCMYIVIFHCTAQRNTDLAPYLHQCNEACIPVTPTAGPTQPQSHFHVATWGPTSVKLSIIKQPPELVTKQAKSAACQTPCLVPLSATHPQEPSS